MFTPQLRGIWVSSPPCSPSGQAEPGWSAARGEWYSKGQDFAIRDRRKGMPVGTEKSEPLLDETDVEAPPLARGLTTSDGQAKKGGVGASCGCGVGLLLGLLVNGIAATGLRPTMPCPRGTTLCLLAAHHFSFLAVVPLLILLGVCFPSRGNSGGCCQYAMIGLCTAVWTVLQLWSPAGPGSLARQIVDPSNGMAALFAIPFSCCCLPSSAPKGSWALTVAGLVVGITGAALHLWRLYTAASSGGAGSASGLAPGAAAAGLSPTISLALAGTSTACLAAATSLQHSAFVGSGGLSVVTLNRWLAAFAAVWMMPVAAVLMLEPSTAKESIHDMLKAEVGFIAAHISKHTLLFAQHVLLFLLYLLSSSVVIRGAGGPGWLLLYA